MAPQLMNSRAGMGSPPVIWLVDDDRSFRDMSDAIAIEAEVAVMTMGVEELAIRRQAHDLPDGIMLDGSVLTTADAEAMLEGIPRIIVCTGGEYAEVAEGGPCARTWACCASPWSLKHSRSGELVAGSADDTSWPTRGHPKPSE
jgi:hypothetical protein